MAIPLIISRFHVFLNYLVVLIRLKTIIQLKIGTASLSELELINITIPLRFNASYQQAE